MSYITKLSDHLGVHWLWISDLGDNIGAHPGLVAAACVREVFCTPFVGIPTAPMTKAPLWVVSDPFYPYILHFRSCIPVLNPLSSTVHASSLCLTCFDVALSFMSVHFMQGVTLFFFFFLRKTASKHSLTFIAPQDCSRFGSAQSFALGLLLHSNRHYSPEG